MSQQPGVKSIKKDLVVSCRALISSPRCPDGSLKCKVTDKDLNTTLIDAAFCRHLYGNSFPL